jgi:hypothetical protein
MDLSEAWRGGGATLDGQAKAARGEVAVVGGGGRQWRSGGLLRLPAVKGKSDEFATG